MTKKEENLKKLSSKVIPMNFVKKCEGRWTHSDWEVFCSSLKEKGYTPIDFDQVGLLLEEKRTIYLEKNKK